MALTSRDFPGCCTAKLLLDFGDSADSEFSDCKFDEDHAEAHLKWALSSYSYCGMLVAMTTTQQVPANEWLKAKGFECTPPCKKEQHHYTDLILWWYPIKGYRDEQTDDV